MPSRIRGLYAIVDPRFVPPSLSVQAYARQLLEGGCRLMQLRCKSPQIRYALARDLLALKRDYDFTCIINDDVACAKALHADGVHLGCDDGSLADARAMLGKSALIGYSSHSLAEARLAQDAGADYVAFGAIFPTQTKGPGHPIQGIQRLQEMCLCLSAPIVAIGGITRTTVADVAATGVAAVAMITGLSYASDPRAETMWYVQELARSGSPKAVRAVV